MRPGKKFLASFILLALLFINGCGLTVKSWERKPDKYVNIEKVIEAIKKQVQAAEQKLKDNNIDVDICEELVSLQVTATNTQSADFQVLIFKPSGNRITQKVTTLTFDLKRVGISEAAKKDVQRAMVNVLTDSLSNLIVMAAKQYNSIKNEVAPGLQKNYFTVDVTFSLEMNGTTDLNFNLFGNGADASWELDDKAQHELTLTFSKTGSCPQ
jgi:hypothetical protein